ncbi:MAG: immune inhibitor A [Anaerolineaceae bacterium]|nr:immune inhibitor A [Anaerolineaceae bacterium]
MKSWSKWSDYLIALSCLSILLLTAACQLASLMSANGSSNYNQTIARSTQETPVTPLATTKAENDKPANIPATPVTQAEPPAIEDWQTLENTNVPESNLVDLAERLQGKKNIPQTLPAPTVPFKIGDDQSFWVSNADTNQTFQVDTTLRDITSHVYFWVQNGLNYDPGQLKTLVSTFEQKIYPTDRAIFGSEWTPGIDNDPHLYIVLAQGLGTSLAGYYSSTDEVPPDAHKFSNGHEMFVLNADNSNLASDFTYGVLAHEFQHMIHWYQDPTADAWVNEGFSELAAYLNNYPVGGFDRSYTSDPDLQLNDWPNDDSSTMPHYGASFLFFDYLYDRFGEKAIKTITAEAKNGMDGIDNALSEIGAKDSNTGQKIGADAVFGDWAVANFLNDSSIENGRYAYSNYPNLPNPKETETISNCPVDWQSRTVHQYGVDYIKITCPGSFKLDFKGQQQVNVLAVDPHSGKYDFWTNKGDDADMTLTHTFDFSQINGSVSFTYWTWYDLEKDYDFVYLEASEDGQNWNILKTPACTEKNLSGNNYGCGYNATSQNWIEQNVDLSQFAGKKVQLRFEYVTDGAVNGEGLLLDDFSISAINYATDFEKDDGGWQAKGFVRIQNTLPQTYSLSLIEQGKTTQVINLQAKPDETLSIPVGVGGDVQDDVLVISGTTRFTRQEANYQFRLRP